MIKGINQAQSLIKELLSLWIAGGDRVMQIAESRHQGCRFSLTVSRMILGCASDTQPQGEQNGETGLHRDGTSLE